MEEDHRSIEIEEDKKVIRLEDEDVEVEEMTWTTKVSSWIGVDGKSVKGVVVTTNGRTNKCQTQACPICFQALANSGNHRICCLPCGHIYGMSCINIWLQRHKNSTRCPQCNSLSTLEDVRPLHSTHLFVADQTLHKDKAFPFTKEGFRAFKWYVSEQHAHALKLLFATLERQGEVAGRWSDALRLSGQSTDALERREKALGLRADALERWVDACKTSMDFFEHNYKEYMH